MNRLRRFWPPSRNARVAILALGIYLAAVLIASAIN